MSVRRVLVIGLVGLSLSTALLAGAKPVAVSPGDASKLVLIADNCPTFSWGQIDGAEFYELVVYQVDEEGEVAEAVLRQRIPGTANGWTPALDRCLSRAGRYAWAVRALGTDDISDWSPPSLFQVAAGPSAAEFEAALRVVRDYLDSGGGLPPSNGFALESTPKRRVPTEALAPSPLLPGPSSREFSVEGTMGADLVVGQSLLGVGVFGHLLHLYPLDSSDGLCLEDSDRGSIWLRSSTNQSPTGDGFCVCVRKWSTITQDWAYVAEALGEGYC